MTTACRCAECPFCVREAQAECPTRECHDTSACADRAQADALRKQVEG